MFHYVEQKRYPRMTRGVRTRTAGFQFSSLQRLSHTPRDATLPFVTSTSPLLLLLTSCQVLLVTDTLRHTNLSALNAPAPTVITSHLASSLDSFFTCCPSDWLLLIIDANVSEAYLSPSLFCLLTHTPLLVTSYTTGKKPELTE